MNANNLKNSNMQIKLNSKTRENTVLVGRAGNYIFFWNKMDESTEILNESEVKTLIINSFQKKNTSFLDAFSRDEWTICWLCWLIIYELAVVQQIEHSPRLKLHSIKATR